MSPHVEAINDLNFETEVLGSELPFLLDFGATWCAPCRALEPIIAELAQRYRGHLRVGKLDIDESQLIATRFAVRGAPTLILFRDGREAARRIGLTSYKALVQLCALPASVAPAAPATPERAPLRP
jgi:thioredoxin